MKVLGIDPGTAACGYGIVHESDGRLRALDHGCWTTGARERPELRLKTIFDGVGALIAEHAPDAVALEESFVGADARIALSVGQARGAVLVAAAAAGVECAEYAPARVKQAVCGYGRADKGQVQRMVKMILALDDEPADLATRPTRSRSRSATRSCRRSRGWRREERRVIARLRGRPAARSPTGSCSTSTASATSSRRRPAVLRRAEDGDEVTVETYLHVREDALQLYGFADAERARALRAAAHRQRRRPEGRARDRLRLARRRAAQRDRARRPRRASRRSPGSARRPPSGSCSS